MTPSITGIRKLAAALTAITLMAAPAFGFDVYLVAQQFTKTMPDATAIDMWGFAPANASFVPTGPATVPGPAITVPPGDTTLKIHLKNALTTQGVSIVIPGQRAALSPVRTSPDVQGRTRVTSFTTEIAPGFTGMYTWNGFKPGTYLYHSGTNPAVQVPMGLYGAATRDAVAGPPAQAYPAKPYDNKVLLLFSEIDPALNAAVIDGTFGTSAYPSAIKFEPTYFLINGQPHPSATAVPAHPIVTGERVLVRFLNAGLKTHVPTLNGLGMMLIAEDGNLYPYPREQYSVLLAAGKTADAYLGGGASGTITVFDRHLALANAGAPGGMVTSLGVAPIVRNVQVVGSSNDAEESASGSTNVDNGDLELVQDSSTQTVGLRFTGVNVPQGAVIERAWVQFQADESHSGTTNLLIQGQAAGSPLAFSSSGNPNFNISARPRTTAQVAWPSPSTLPLTVPPWTAPNAGLAQQTSDIKTIIQEIVNRNDYTGNTIALIITGSGRRTAESYDGLPSGAALLRVEYSIANPLGVATTTTTTTTTTTSSTTTTTTTSSTTTTTSPPGAFIFEKRITSNSDDAEESASGSVDTGSGDLELVQEESTQKVGLRFTGVTIPVGATITNAWVQFQVDETTSNTPPPATLTIRGQVHLTNNPPTFSSSNKISTRQPTTASVTWTPGAWLNVGDALLAQQTSPSLAAVIQEVVNGSGWSGNNPLVLIITGTGKRVAESREGGGSSGAPMLHVEYTP